MPELDWIVEHEELPPDEPYYPVSEPQPVRRHRFPAWAWWVVGLLAISAAIVAVLWILGGKDEPLPPPEPELASLEAAVGVEIGALNSRDREIYERQQDIPSRRRNFLPPRDVSFGDDEPPGRFELIDLQPLGAGKARADVGLEWGGTTYRLVWFYSQEDERWVHTDWVPGQLTTTLTLTTTFLTIEYHPEEAKEAAALAEQTEQLIAGLCSQLTCTRQLGRLTIAFDPLHVNPAVDENANYLRLPSPVRFRWPVDGEPEPMVMGSLGRHLADRLLAPSASTALGVENRNALDLVGFWFAHHLLDLETLPGTLWLDEVEAREGTMAVAALAEAIRSGVPPQEAVRVSLQTETVAAVARQADYMTWLALIAGPPRLLSDYDDAANPWAPAGQSYRTIWPELTNVVFRGGWAAGIVDPESIGPAMIYFRQVNGDWHVVDAPDEGLFGERKERVAGPFAIIYYEWDEDYIESLVEMLVDVHERVMANSGLEETTTYRVNVIPCPGFARGSADISIESPALKAWVGEPPISDEEFMLVAGSVLSRVAELDTLREERMLMLVGLFLWQLEDLGVSPERWYSMIEFTEAEEWRPPKTVGDEAWLPLAQLWQTPMDEPPADLLAQYLWAPYLLTEYIVETYGREQVRVMSIGLATAGSVEAWIAAITGQPLEKFEPAWRKWVIAQWQQ